MVVNLVSGEHVVGRTDIKTDICDSRVATEM